ncbi:MAG: hypothetical protein V2A73_14280, partial [Pseudomonadota bacterium]
MRNGTWKGAFQLGGIVLLTALVSCEERDASLGPKPIAEPIAVPVVAAQRADLAAFPSGVRAAIQALPSVHVASINKLGIPSFISGNLGQAQATVAGASAAAVERDMAPVVARLAPALGGRAAELRLKKLSEDDLGFVTIRYDQVKNGLPVVNGEMFVSVDPSGKVNAAGGLLADENLLPEPILNAAAALDVAELDAQTATSKFSEPSLVYIYLPDETGRRLRLAWRTMEFGGQRDDGLPIRETVFVDAYEGRVIQRYTHVFTALDRKIWTFNGSTSWPTYPNWLAAVRMEGEAPVENVHANAAYNAIGDVYNCVGAVFGLDSFAGNGHAQEVAVNWGNSQFNAAAVDYYEYGVAASYRPHIMVGDGDGTTFSSPQISVDLLGHEFGHLMVMSSVLLKPEGESYVLHEHYADFVGAICEAW